MRLLRIQEVIRITGLSRMTIYRYEKTGAFLTQQKASVSTALLRYIRPEDLHATVTLEYRDIKHVRPVFHGDTIYARSRVLSKADGAVTIMSEGLNQKDEVVLSLERVVS